jgi:asparagine synthetase B (glutamine-hydrolysing)
MRYPIRADDHSVGVVEVEGIPGTTMITDVAGIKPVYYTWCVGGTVWATQAAPLADLTSATLDFPAITTRMTCPTVSEVCGSAIAFTGVRRLPGGHVLQVEEGMTQIRRYEPLDEQQPFEPATRCWQSPTTIRPAATTTRDTPSNWRRASH